MNSRWKKAPLWAQWTATDSDGEIVWYENEPELKRLHVTEGRLFWSNGVGRWAYSGLVEDATDQRWLESKVARQEEPVHG